MKYIFIIFIIIFIFIIFVLPNSAPQNTLSAKKPLENGTNDKDRGTVEPLFPEPKIFYKHPLALVIGNEKYEHNSLINPVNDAKAMRALLKKMGFEVTLKTNLNQRAMNEAIDDFGKQLLKSRGIGLFFFAGHGAQIDGQNYLLPINNKMIQYQDDLEKKNILYADQILKLMEKAKTTLNIIILDACRDNPYRTRERGEKKEGLKYMQAPLGSIIAFATAPGETTPDISKSGNNGLYTSHLLVALEKAYQTHQRIDDMFMAISRAVSEETKGRQAPWYSFSLREPFCFNGCENEGPQMVSIPAGRFKMGNIQGN
ncbi:peptidase C14 caspase catalytic subunit p20, partial [Candidatus Thiomargarita nelsonii]